MNENNELLLHLYQITDMGVKSTEKLLNLLKNKENKIKKILEDELKEYEKFYKKTEKLLTKEKVEPKPLGKMSELMANMEMKIEVSKDNSDAKIADILTRGFTMGILETKKKLDNYKNQTDKKFIELTQDILKFQEKEIENLKNFL